MGHTDKQQAVKIITEAFAENPSVNWVIKNDKKRTERIKVLANYSYLTAKRRDGVYFSSNKKGIALCYRYNSYKETLTDYWNQLILVLKAIGINRVPEIMKRESYIKSKYPKDQDFLYFWFFGVTSEEKGSGAARELKSLLFELADRHRLPIYLETSVIKNKRVYERFGFQTYHSWDLPGKELTLWFMRREPSV